jgi:hypothetical protein
VAARFQQPVIPLPPLAAPFQRTVMGLPPPAAAKYLKGLLKPEYSNAFINPLTTGNYGAE